MRTAAVLLFALSAADPATSEDKPSRPDAPARLVVQTRLPGATEGAEFVMAGKAVLMWSVGDALVADRETGRTLRTFPVGSVRVAHGRNLAVGSPALGTALKMPVLRPYLFDAAADADPKPVGPDDFRCIAYELTTDGKWLVTYQTDQQAASKRPTLAVWDAHTGKPVRSFDAVALAWEGGHRPLVALRGGHLVAAGHYDKTIRLWDVTAGKEVKRIDAGELSGNLAAAADGQAVAAATADGGTVWGCDGKLHGKLPLKNARGVVLSDDGKRVCVWRNDLVAGWVVAKAKPLFHEADWHARPVGWDADGKLQAVRFAGGLARTSPLPGPPAGEAPKDMPDVKRVDTAGLAGPDLLYTVSNVNVVAPTRVRFWDLANGAPVGQPPGLPGRRGDGTGDADGDRRRRPRPGRRAAGLGRHQGDRPGRVGGEPEGAEGPLRRHPGRPRPVGDGRRPDHRRGGRGRRQDRPRLGSANRQGRLPRSTVPQPSRRRCTLPTTARGSSSAAARATRWPSGTPRPASGCTSSRGASRGPNRGRSPAASRGRAC